MGIVAAAGNQPSTILGSDLFWTIVAAIAAVVAIIVSVVLYIRSRQVKALAYQASDTALIREEAHDLVEILYEGRPVSDVHLVTVGIANVGNVPIRREDFEGDLVIELPGAPTLLDAKLTGAIPRDLTPAVSIAIDRVTIAPLLLNPGDIFELQILAAHQNADAAALSAATQVLAALDTGVPRGSDSWPAAVLLGRVAGVDVFRTSFETPAARFLKGLAEAVSGTALVIRPTGMWR
jgi:hypothetical protein